jgi:hypothetical protein
MSLREKIVHLTTTVPRWTDLDRAANEKWRLAMAGEEISNVEISVLETERDAIERAQISVTDWGLRIDWFQRRAQVALGITSPTVAPSGNAA